MKIPFLKNKPVAKEPNPAKDLALKLESEIQSIDFSSEFIKFNPPENIKFDMMFDFANPYYKALAAYCKIYSPKNVLDVGTFRGASAIALAKYAKNVTSIDVFPQIFNLDILKYVTIHQVPVDACYNWDYSQYDFIFIDTTHTGKDELLIHNRLLETYHGFVFWDDSKFCVGMREFWFNIKNKKYSPKWHVSGFGIVFYP